MLDALAAGERDPKALAQLARGRMRVKIPRIEEALDCSFFTPTLAGLLRRMLDLTDQFTAQIEDLDQHIAVLAAPFEDQPAGPPRTSSPRPGSTWACSPPLPTWCPDRSSAPR
jgi:hypothetical protein